MILNISVYSYKKSRVKCLCALESEANGEREAAGPDPGLPGQRVGCGRPAGGR